MITKITGITGITGSSGSQGPSGSQGSPGSPEDRGSAPAGHRARYVAGDRIGRPVSGLVGYNNGPAHRGGYFTDIGSGTLVPRGMDRRPRSGFPGGFRIGSYGTIMQILPDTAEGGSTGGSVATDAQKTARCQWIADHDFGMLVLHGVIFGSPDGISSFGVWWIRPDGEFQCWCPISAKKP